MPIAARPWSPMTDPEWDALRPLLATNPARGGRPTDARAVWDGIFWVACSKAPWRALPAALGRGNTAHRALLRAAQDGRLERLLRAAATPAFAPLAWRLLRAFRRAARAMPLRLLLLAQQLGQNAALPCAPSDLPKPGLSEIIRRHAPKVLSRETCTPGLLHMLSVLQKQMAGRQRVWRLR